MITDVFSRCPRDRLATGLGTACRTFARLATVAFALSFSMAWARAPIVAPVPPQKSLSTTSDQDTTVESLDTSKTIDAEKAREMLMEQLLRAAQAGIVEMQPASGTVPERETPIEDTNNAESNRQVSTESLSETNASGDADHDDSSDVVTPLPGEDQTQSVSSGDVEPEAIANLAQQLRVSGGAEQKTSGSGQIVTEVPIVENEPAEPKQVVAARCFSRTQLTLPDVVSGEHFAHLIGEQRKALVGEFDKAQPETAVALAKTYLAAGMMHEAKAIIDEFAPGDPMGRFVLDVASVWMGDTVASGSSLLKDDCIGTQALWRAFAQARGGESEKALRSEVSSGAALEELPLHVRQVVASELGLVAAKMGQWDAARRLAAMAKRAADGEGRALGATHLLQFRLAKWRNDAVEAEKQLALAAASDPDTATEALLIRAEEALNSDDVLNPSHGALRMDLGALARRETGTDIAQRAFELEARLFHRNAGPDETISFLSDAVELGLLDQERHPTFLSELISKPAYSDTERPLAHIYLDDPQRFEDAIDQAALRRSLIRSLAQEGVPGVAFDLAQGSDLQDTTVAVQVAQSFVDVAEYREAIATLSKADDGAPQRVILSKAFLGMGDFEKAISVLDEIPPEITVTPNDALMLSEARLKAALAGRDFASAFETAEAQLEKKSDHELALQSALYALENGASEIPKAVREILSEGAGDELKLLEEIYALNRPVLDDLDQDVEGLLKSLEGIETGEGAILEFLENG